jgi:hypothetical protein
MMKSCALVLLFATVCQGQRVATLTVNKKQKYTKPVSVSFTISDPSDMDWFAIYKYTIDDPLDYNPWDADEDLLFWTYACGTQDRGDCSAISDGEVVFNGVDPTEEYDDQWPMLNGMYKVCHFREGEDDEGDETAELLQPCKPFNVRFTSRFKSKWPTGSVEPVKSTYDEGETVVAQFDAGTYVPNGWIGIFKKGETNPSDYLVWIYTGCNNVVGDQDGDGVVDDGKSNDCKKMRRKGKVTFNENTLYRNGPEEDWPLPAGEYFLRLQYKNNTPYNLYKDSTTTFTVVE